MLMLQEERALEYSGFYSEKPPPFACVNWDGDQRTHRWFGRVGTCSVRLEPHIKTGLLVWQNFGRKSEFTALQTVEINPCDQKRKASCYSWKQLIGVTWQCKRRSLYFPATVPAFQACCGEGAGKLQQHGMEHATCPGAFTQEFPNWK